MNTGLSRRTFINSLAALPLLPWTPATELQPMQQVSQLPIRVSTLNHVSFGCADLRRTVEWYGRVFGMPVHAFQDYAGGQTVVRVGSGPSYIALSQEKAGTNRQADTLPHFC